MKKIEHRGSVLECAGPPVLSNVARPPKSSRGLEHSRTLPCLFSIILLLAALTSPAREVQSHGLIFEKWLRDTFFGGYEPKGYTQKWDIPASANLNHGHVPVNPKAAKHGSPVGLGDAVRQFEIVEPFLLIVGFWEQVTPKKKSWVNVQATEVQPETWKKLWGKITKADLERLIAVIKNKSLSIEETRAQAQLIKSQEPFTSAIIELNPKIDRSQRRLQCSLSFEAFFDHLAPKAERGKLEKPQVFGVPLPASFTSAPRVLTPEQ